MSKAYDPEILLGLLHGTLSVCRGNLAEFPKMISATLGVTLREALQQLNCPDERSLANAFPDKFFIQYGKLMAVGDEETQHVIDDMNRSKTAPKKGGRGGGRGGGSRGGRAGGSYGYSSRGGNSFRPESTPPTFGSSRPSVPRGSGGFSNRGGPTRPATSFSNNNTSGFGGGGGGGSGFGGANGGGGYGSNGNGGGFGGNRGAGGGGTSSATGYGGARREPSPPRGGGGGDRYNDDSYGRSDNRGFASNYDNFEESRDYDDRGRHDNRTYSNNGRDDYRRDDGYDDQYDRREPPPRRERDDYEYEASRGSDRGGNDRYPNLTVSRTVSNEYYEGRRANNDDYDDRRDDRRGGGRRDEEYRPPRYLDEVEEEWRNEDRREDDRGHRRDDRDEPRYEPPRRGGYDYDLDDEDYGRQEERRGGDERRTFPSALAAPRLGPQPVSDDEDELPVPSQQQRGRSERYYDNGGHDDRDRQRRSPTRSNDDARHRRRGSYERNGEPEDPVQQHEEEQQRRQPCRPSNTAAAPPPGFESVRDALGAPPGLGTSTAPPPGLPLPPRDPTKHTPAARAIEQENLNAFSLEKMAQLVLQTAQMAYAAGDDVIKVHNFVGFVLKYCKEDITRVVEARGKALTVLETVCKRSNGRMSFETNDDGVDFVMLHEPFRRQAKELYGRQEKFGQRAVGMAAPDAVESDDDEEDDYRSARSSNKAPVSYVPSEVRQANNIWKFVRTQGEYKQAKNGSVLPLHDLAKYAKMTVGQLTKYVTRPEFEKFFRVDFDEGGGVVVAIYHEGPSANLLKEFDDDDSISEDRSSSTVGSSMQRQSAAPLRPSEFTFYHRRDDPLMGWESVRAYKAKEDVVLTAFQNFTEFYVATERDYRSMDKMARDLFNDHCMLPFNDLQHWTKGHAGCYLDPKEKVAYRVSILSLDKEKEMMRILFVDTGAKKMVDVRDVVPLTEPWKKEAKCFRCSLEEFDPWEEDDLFDLYSTMTKLTGMTMTIEPQQKLHDEQLLIVAIKFFPPNARSEKQYPEDLYRKKWAAPKRGAPRD